MGALILMGILVAVIFVALLAIGCGFAVVKYKVPPEAKIVSPGPKLTSEWHAEEEAKMDAAVQELRRLGKWNEAWNGFEKFSRLGTYGWRSNMNCGTTSRPEPCMSGGYSYSEDAFQRLKRGDESHDPRNTPEESFHSQLTIIRKLQRQP